MSKNILITGATGLIGKRLFKVFLDRSDSVTIVSRSTEKAKTVLPNANKYLEWDFSSKLILPADLTNIDAVIHLAGENVMARRWNDDHKKRIYDSRITSTKLLVDSFRHTDNKPKAFICASAVGYYGSSADMEFTEESKPGDNFLANVTKRWEEEAEKAEEMNIRTVSIRTGIVLSTEGGAFKKMLTPFKFFIGGPLGSGKQWFPWIHIDDLAGLFLLALDNSNVKGPINGTAPETLRMSEFCKIMGKVMHRPSMLKVPSFVLKILYGEGAGEILSGQKVIPKKAMDAGYNFKFANAEMAIKELLIK
jgi:uncharacterized protein (TIGR01777 family)